MPAEALIGLYSSTVRTSLTLKTQRGFYSKKLRSYHFPKYGHQSPKTFATGLRLSIVVMH